MNILLTISYDGTNYCGWQRQKNGLSVQECVENALAEVLKRDKVTLTACSRTDAGVHAADQKACFEAENLLIPPEKLPQVLNSRLPGDVVITHATEAEPGFNPRYRAKQKTYTYSILNAKYNDPKLRNYSCHIPYELDTEKMKEACKYFIGTHDFKAFSATGSQQKTSIRTIYNAELTQENNLLTFTVTGNGFLYNMVRILAGTLLYVGLNKIHPEEISEIIEKRDRTLAGKTVPPQGLTLLRVEF